MNDNMKTFDLVCATHADALDLALELDEEEIDSDLDGNTVTIPWPKSVDHMIMIYEVAVELGYMTYESASDQLVSYL